MHGEYDADAAPVRPSATAVRARAGSEGDGSHDSKVSGRAVGQVRCTAKGAGGCSCGAGSGGGGGACAAGRRQDVARRAAYWRGVEERQRLQEEEAEAARLEAEARASAQRAALRQRLDMEAKVRSRPRSRSSHAAGPMHRRHAWLSRCGMQMAYNAEQKRIAAAETRRGGAGGDDAEAAYQARVQKAAQYEPPTYFGRPKVQWFY